MNKVFVRGYKTGFKIPATFALCPHASTSKVRTSEDKAIFPILLLVQDIGRNLLERPTQVLSHESV
jgi:hypothetical protein